MDCTKAYLKFPSKAPFAWLVYYMVGTNLARICNLVVYFRHSNSSINSIFSLLIFLSAAILIILSDIQAIVNIIRILKKEEKLTAKKVLITSLILLVIFVIFNPLANNFIHTITNNTKLMLDF